jgi:hypothetical protein
MVIARDAVAQSFTNGKYSVRDVSPGVKALVDVLERLRFGIPKVSLFSPFSDFPCEELHPRIPPVLTRLVLSTAGILVGSELA